MTTTTTTPGAPTTTTPTAVRGQCCVDTRDWIGGFDYEVCLGRPSTRETFEAGLHLDLCGELSSYDARLIDPFNDPELLDVCRTEFVPAGTEDGYFLRNKVSFRDKCRFLD